MIQRSLILLKPDAVARGLSGEIISRIERSGLKMIAAKLVHPDLEIGREHYKKDIEWKNKVHERLSGWKTIANLPHGYDLIHPKTIERQEKQNSFYDTI